MRKKCADKNESVTRKNVTSASLFCQELGEKKGTVLLAKNYGEKIGI